MYFLTKVHTEVQKAHIKEAALKKKTELMSSSKKNRHENKTARFLKNASELDVDRKSLAERLCSCLTDGCLIIPHTFPLAEQ